MPLWTPEDMAAQQELERMYAASQRSNLGEPPQFSGLSIGATPVQSVTTSAPAAAPAINISAPAAAPAAASSPKSYVVGGVLKQGEFNQADWNPFNTAATRGFQAYETAEQKRQRLGI